MLEIKWNEPFRVRSDQNFWDPLWKWSMLTDQVISYPGCQKGFDVSACGRHPAKVSRRTRERTSGTQVSHFGSVGPKCPFSCFQEVNDQTRGGLRWVCATGLYLSIGHVEFSKFLTEIFVSCDSKSRPKRLMFYEVKSKWRSSQCQTIT